ncbi:MAG: acetate/propionate family kinase, partial [Acidimicrobiales bacterium]
PAVACFDTAFHATLAPAAATYAVPAAWRDRLHVRRYGFHGLSHAYAARRASAAVGDAGRVVTCHLGAGASLAAVRGGRCVDTTMGFTPLEGLVMATRSGTVDPGAVLWLITRRGLDPGAVAHALEHESGLLALAGTADMAAVVDACRRGEAAAKLALDVYVHRLRAAIASMVASLGGLDAVVFTGGVGENAPTVRAAAASGLAFLGVALDTRRNEEAIGRAARPEVDITATGSSVRALVVAAREDLEIARGVRARLR